jgi:LysR family hydrogen peroxide-inducible transcriptional activator
MRVLPTLRQLEYVVAVAETGQFVEAARRCGVSQPALSKQVKEVEELLQAVIFERSRPRVLPTPVGERVVAQARRVLGEARQLVDLARAERGQPGGTLRLGVIPTMAPYGLAGLLARLRRLHPELAFAIEECQTEVLLQRLRAGELDLGLLARSFDDHGLAGVDLVWEPFVLVAPADHPLATREAVSPRSLQGASLILMSDGHCLRDQASDVCALAGAGPPTSVEAASVSTLVRMVESGLGATLLPATALPVELRAGDGLVARRFDHDAPGRTLTLQWRASTPYRDWFVGFAEQMRAHYLDGNGALPDVCGGRVALRPCEP